MPPAQPISSITPVTPANIQQANQAGQQRKQMALESQRIQTQKDIAQQQMAQQATELQANMFISGEKMAQDRAIAELQSQNYARLNENNLRIEQMRDARSREALASVNARWQSEFDLRERQYTRLIEADRNNKKMQWEIALGRMQDPEVIRSLEQEQANMLEERLRLHEAELEAQGKEAEIVKLRPKVRQGIKDDLDMIDQQVDRGLSGFGSGMGQTDIIAMFPEADVSLGITDAIFPDAFSEASGGLREWAFFGEQLSPREAREFTFLQNEDNVRRAGEKYLGDAILEAFKAMEIARPEMAAEAVRSAIDTLRSDSADPIAINQSLNRALVAAGANPMAFGELMGRVETLLLAPDAELERTALISQGDAQELELAEFRNYIRAKVERAAVNPFKRLKAVTSDMAPMRTWLATAEGSEESPFGIDDMRALMENDQFRDLFGDETFVREILPLLEGLDAARGQLIRDRGALERREIFAEERAGELGRIQELLGDQREAEIRGRYLDLDLPLGGE